MSKPTEEELRPLAKAKREDDSERGHIAFDNAMEAKLRELDPEWMEAMDKYYDESGLSMWYA